jgi:hypothetical protein
MDELRLLIAQLTVKALLVVLVLSAGVVGSQPTFAEVLVAPPGGVNSSCVEAQVPLEVSSVLGRELSMGGGSCLIEAVRSLAMEFLTKVRVEVDQVLFFGLGLRINASMDIRRRLGRVLTRLGLKPKLLHGFNLRGRCKRSTASRVKPNGEGERILDSSLEKMEEEVMLVTSVGDDVMLGFGAVGSDEVATQAGEGVASSLAKPVSPSKEEAELATGNSESSFSEEVSSLSDEVVPKLLPLEEEAKLAMENSESSSSEEVPSVSDEVVLEMDQDLDLVPGKVAIRYLSPGKGMLRRGFLLCRILAVVPERHRLRSPEISASPPVISVGDSEAQGQNFLSLR